MGCEFLHDWFGASGLRIVPLSGGIGVGTSWDGSCGMHATATEGSPENPGSSSGPLWRRPLPSRLSRCMPQRRPMCDTSHKWEPRGYSCVARHRNFPPPRNTHIPSVAERRAEIHCLTGFPQPASPAILLSIGAQTTNSVISVLDPSPQSLMLKPLTLKHEPLEVVVWP